MPAVFHGCRRSTDTRVEDKLVEVARKDRRRRDVRGSGGRVGEINFFFTGGSSQLGRNDRCPAFIERCDSACVTAL